MLRSTQKRADFRAQDAKEICAGSKSSIDMIAHDNVSEFLFPVNEEIIVVGTCKLPRGLESAIKKLVDLFTMSSDEQRRFESIQKRFPFTANRLRLSSNNTVNHNFESAFDMN